MGVGGGLTPTSWRGFLRAGARGLVEKGVESALTAALRFSFVIPDGGRNGVFLPRLGISSNQSVHGHAVSANPSSRTRPQTKPHAPAHATASTSHTLPGALPGALPCPSALPLQVAVLSRACAKSRVEHMDACAHLGILALNFEQSRELAPAEFDQSSLTVAPQVIIAVNVTVKAK